MFAKLAALFSPKPEPVNPRRVAFVLASASERATVAEWCGRNHWKG